MTVNGWLQIAIFFALILVCAKPLGSFIATIVEGRRNFLTPILGPVERLIYKVCGITEDGGTALDAIRGRSAGFQRVQRGAALCDPEAAGLVSVQSARLWRGQCQPGPRL